MKWLNRIFASIADLLILCVILLFVSLSVTDGFSAISWSAITIIGVVFVCYLLSVLVVSVLLFVLRGAEGRFVAITKSIISALLILYIFPKSLQIGFILTGSWGVSSVVESALLVAFVGRAILAAYLGRRWGQPLID